MKTLESTPLIGDIKSSAYAIPTDKPEGDGTFLWRETVLVLAEVSAANVVGIGFTYAAAPRRRSD
jgi:hypothetical protein